MSPVRFMGLLACASVAIGLGEDQGLTVPYPLWWQQQENSSQSLKNRELTFTVCHCLAGKHLKEPCDVQNAGQFLSKRLG